MKSIISIFMLIKLDKIFIFSMFLAKIKSLMSRKMQNFEDQYIGQFEANLQIESMCEAANYELRVYIFHPTNHKYSVILQKRARHCQK